MTDLIGTVPVQCGMILLNGYVDTRKNTSVYSLLDCTSMCLDTSGCTSFFYSKDTKLCHLAGVRYFSASSLMSVSGYKYYLQRPDCGPGWILLSDRCYRYRSDALKFNDAKISCESIGGYLATTNSIEEDVVIKSFITGPAHTMWLGGSDEAIEGQWEWIDGQAITLDLWEASLLRRSATYNCLEQTLQGWMDGNCLWSLPYLCEK